MRPALAISMTCLFVVTGAVGCRAPMPSLKSSQLLSALGTTRVPPPATRSFVTASRYTNEAASSTAKNPTSSDNWRTATQKSDADQPRSGDARLVPQANSTSPSNRLTQSTGNAVQSASYVTTSGTSAQARVIGEGNSTVRLNGMHVNEASSSTPPNAFVPSSSMAPLPQGNTSQSQTSGSGAMTNSTSSSLDWRSRT